MVWEDITEVEEGVLTMEEDQGSHHLFLTHFQPCPYHLALVKAEDIMLYIRFSRLATLSANWRRSCSKTKKELESQRSCPNPACPFPFISVPEFSYRCRPDSSSPAQRQFCLAFQRGGAHSRMPGVRGCIVLY